MRLSLLPAVMADSLTALQPEHLKEMGVRLLMLDFDNTIVPYTTDLPAEAIENWLGMMQSSDVQICVVSNSRKGRVPAFCEARGIPCITHACKPLPTGIRSCLSRYNLPASQAALVGDQIYTDILGANLSGVTSILIPAINNHNFLLKFRHILELPAVMLANTRAKHI